MCILYVSMYINVHTHSSKGPYSYLGRRCHGDCPGQPKSSGSGWWPMTEEAGRFAGRSAAVETDLT